MIQHVSHSESKFENDVENKPSLSWTELSKLHVGRCQCTECERCHAKSSINTTEEKEQLDQTSECMKTFAQPLFPYKVHNTERNTTRLDVGEVKTNILESAFDTAESVASIGAIVSLI